MSGADAVYPPRVAKGRVQDAGTHRTEDLAPAVALFRGLADPTRLVIAQRLAVQEARVVDLVAELGLAQSTVSTHLSCLRECGLVDYRPQGRASVYFLVHPELLEVFASAERLLAATGESVVLCPNYGERAAPKKKPPVRRTQPQERSPRRVARS